MTLLALAAAGAIAVFFAAVMVTSRSLYVSAVCLLVVLLQTAVIFLLRGAPLLGLLQVMIYAGAVMVLVVITIMATGGEPEKGFRRFADFSFWRGGAAGALIVFACYGVSRLLHLDGGAAPAGAPVPVLSVELGRTLFGAYAPAVEAATLLMFLAALAILPDREESR
ncbi:MAG: NADH-quinone oxidoreductase subunit J [Elusimicrobia bacterium]|nr:NADH-quinone oxidoreductase subunit J [Elusimicrobiota bacterium]